MSTTNEHFPSLIKRIGNNIRAQRVEQGYSQEAMAHLAGLDRSYYGAIERGEQNVTVKTLYAIATALKTNIKELVK